MSAKTQDYYRVHADERREYSKAHRRENGERYALRRRLSYTEQKRRHPRRTRAIYLLANAVADGRKEKPTNCSECGGGGLIHGHHHDYDKPLDVEWLCHDCHMKRHRRVLSATLLPPEEK